MRILKNINTNNIIILLEPLLYNIKVKILKKNMYCVRLFMRKNFILPMICLTKDELVMRE